MVKSIFFVSLLRKLISVGDTILNILFQTCSLVLISEKISTNIKYDEKFLLIELDFTKIKKNIENTI